MWGYDNIFASAYNILPILTIPSWTPTHVKAQLKQHCLWEAYPDMTPHHTTKCSFPQLSTLFTLQSSHTELLQSSNMPCSVLLPNILNMLSSPSNTFSPLFFAWQPHLFLRSPFIFSGLNISEIKDGSYDMWYGSYHLLCRNQAIYKKHLLIWRLPQLNYLHHT